MNKTLYTYFHRSFIGIACIASTLCSVSLASSELTARQIGERRNAILTELSAQLESKYIYHVAAGRYKLHHDINGDIDVPSKEKARLIAAVNELNELRELSIQLIAKKLNKSTQDVEAQLIHREMTSAKAKAFAESESLLFRYVICKPNAIAFTDKSLRYKSKIKLNKFQILKLIDSTNRAYHIEINYMGKISLLWVEKLHALPWNQFLCLKFPNPKDIKNGDRQRVLFFKSLETLQQLSKIESGEDRASLVSHIYDEIETKASSPDVNIVAIEPKQWNSQSIYPILNHENNIYIGSNGNALEIAAMTEQVKGSEVTASNSERKLAAASGFPVDIVFVIDLTNSMHKSIASIKENIYNLSKAYKDTPGLNLNFSLWGYRDDTNICPGFNFVTKNYTNLKMLPIAQFLPTLRQVKAASASDPDFYEDVLKGVSDAAELTEWRKDSKKVIVLIGDAPGREGLDSVDPTCKQSNKAKGTLSRNDDGSAWDFASLRERLNSKKITLISVYLTYPRWSKYLRTGKSQFAKLGAGGVEVYKGDSPDKRIEGLHHFLGKHIAQYAKNQLQIQATGKFDRRGDDADRAVALANDIFESAYVEWLDTKVKQEERPSDIRGWVFTKDLKNSRLSSVSPYILMSRKHLNDLYNTLIELTKALRNKEGPSESAGSFSEAILATSTYSAKDPNQLAKGKSKLNLELIENLANSLPFRSAVMNLNQETFEMDIRAQKHLAIRLQGILKFIRESYADQSMWMRMNSEEDHSDSIMLYPLNMLP